MNVKIVIKGSAPKELVFVFPDLEDRTVMNATAELGEINSNYRSRSHPGI